MSKEKWVIAYKRVYKKTRGVYHSSYVYQFPALDTKYRLGCLVEAKVGGIFCFRTLKAAKNDVDGNTILKVLAKYRISPPREKFTEAFRINSIARVKKLWQDPDPEAKNWYYGTVCYKEIIPLEEVGKSAL